MTNEIKIVKFMIDKLEKENDGECIFVDVGLNDGYYSNLAAFFGCRVIAFEIQEMCIKDSENAALKNNFRDKIHIYQNPVTKEDTELELNYSPDFPCSGLYTMSRKNCHDCPEKKFKQKKKFQAVSLDKFFKSCNSEIIFLKIDVEGKNYQMIQFYKIDLFFSIRARTRSSDRCRKIVQKKANQIWGSGDYT